MFGHKIIVCGDGQHDLIAFWQSLFGLTAERSTLAPDVLGSNLAPANWFSSYFSEMTIKRFKMFVDPSVNISDLTISSLINGPAILRLQR